MWIDEAQDFKIQKRRHPSLVPAAIPCSVPRMLKAILCRLSGCIEAQAGGKGQRRRKTTRTKSTGKHDAATELVTWSG
jgi:hypothetical protein